MHVDVSPNSLKDLCMVDLETSPKMIIKDNDPLQVMLMLCLM